MMSECVAVTIEDYRARMAVACAEYWKLLRGFERAMAMVPIDAKAGLAAQLRYSAGKLDKIAEDLQIRVVSFDGAPFEVNVPAVAVNGDDFSADDEVVVEHTLEPAIVHGSVVLLAGKVYLKKKS